MNILMWATVFCVGCVVMTPVGPVSTIIIRRSLLFGWSAGVIAAIGDCLAVVIYATIGVTGSTFLTHSLVPFTMISHLIVAFVLAIVAMIMWSAKPKLPETNMPSTTNLISGFAMTFGLAMMNPADSILFAAVFAGLGIVIHTPLEYVVFFTLMFAGGLAYWVVLVSFLNKWRFSLKPVHIMVLNRVCAGLMGVVSASSLFSITKI